MSDAELIQGKTGRWEMVIGLEVHAQVISKAKLFSGAATTFGASPNTQVSFIDAGFPGMLPTLNEFCVRQAIKTGLGLNAQINPYSAFDRKNYFYADLPNGYQITQFHFPIVGKGHLDIEKSDGSTKRIGIGRIHLEQDAGKSLHDLHPSQSYIDLNRAGVALMEIVSDPDMRSPEEVALYIKKLRSILRYLETCDGNMDEGSLRADVNVSVRRLGEDFGTRVEIKNVNSIRFMQQALVFEAQRQVQALEAGQMIVQETRLFDAQLGATRPMRHKEDAKDYRYFPEPDLPPLRISEALIHQLKAELPELPDQKRKRFIKDFGLSDYDAGVLVAEKEITLFFETAVSRSVHPPHGVAKLIANWIMGDFFAALHRSHQKIEQSPLSPAQIAELVDLIFSEVISGKIAKDVFLDMWQTGESAAQIVQKKGLQQISDETVIAKIISEILDQQEEKVRQYQAGKEQLFGFFVGQVMKAMKGQGNPTLINQVLQKVLTEKRP